MSGEAFVSLAQFPGRMAPASPASVKAPCDFGAPGGVISLGQSAQVIRQFQTIFIRENFDSLFQFRHAHIGYVKLRGSDFQALSQTPKQNAAG